MTAETAKRMIKGQPWERRQKAQKDIEERAYVEETLVPVFELEGNCYQMAVPYRFRAADGEYVFGRAWSLDEFIRLHQAADEGRAFRVMYLKNARIIVELEEAPESAD